MLPLPLNAMINRLTLIRWRTIETNEILKGRSFFADEFEIESALVSNTQ